MQHSLVVKDSLSPPVEEQTGCCALHLVEVKEGLYQTDVVHAENTMWADKGWISCPFLAQILWRKYGRRTRSEHPWDDSSSPCPIAGRQVRLLPLTKINFLL